MFKKAVMFIICLPIVHFALAFQVRAEEINLSVTGNGEGSSNATQVQNNSSTTVTQTNTAEVNNNVNTNLNTGGNTVNDNNGAASIQTGNVTTNTAINNENINSNNANINPCCGGSSTNIDISGNGSNSSNSVNATNNGTNNIYQTNNANINNNVNIHSNTGFNSANDNNGDVSIKTGSIWATTKIANKNINNSVALGGSFDSTLHASILNNGTDSENNIEFSNNNINNLFVTNTANITNNVEKDLNTGYNNANGNLGDVAIITGDVTSEVEINNENINSSTAILPCLTCQTPEDPKDPPTTPTPVSISQSATGNSGGDGRSDGKGGSVLGAVLPVTGIPFMFYATIFLFMLFFSGVYLRYHSGVSPPVVA